MQRYRRWIAVDGGDSAARPLSGKKGNDHKRMRAIFGRRRPNAITGCNHRVGRPYVTVYDKLEVHELQVRHKVVPNQGSSYNLS